jgi:hypothetical protein
MSVAADLPRATGREPREEQIRVLLGRLGDRPAADLREHLVEERTEDDLREHGPEEIRNVKNGPREAPRTRTGALEAA